MSTFRLPHGEVATKAIQDGFDVLTWMRTQPALKRVPIVVLTASTRTEDVERAFDLGASSYLVKPSKLEDLTEMIAMSARLASDQPFPAPE